MVFLALYGIKALIRLPHSGMGTCMIYLSEYEPVGRRDVETGHELGRELLRFALERNYGRGYVVGRNGNGKPFLKGMPEIDFSISHTRGLVMCGIAERKIGVDVEYVRQFDKRLMGRICTEDEIGFVLGEDEEGRAERFFRLWTLKESFLKATGWGLSYPMREIHFSFHTKEGHLSDIRGNVSGWQYGQFRYRDKFVVAVCEEKPCDRHE